MARRHNGGNEYPGKIWFDASKRVWLHVTHLINGREENIGGEVLAQSHQPGMAIGAARRMSGANRFAMKTSPAVNRCFP